jgi:hypothetical protein
MQFIDLTIPPSPSSVSGTERTIYYFFEIFSCDKLFLFHGAHIFQGVG